MRLLSYRNVFCRTGTRKLDLGSGHYTSAVESHTNSGTALATNWPKHGLGGFKCFDAKL